MILKIEQAKEKWCPMARSMLLYVPAAGGVNIVKDQVTHNRVYVQAKKDADGKEIIPPQAHDGWGTKCLADGCMWWVELNSTTGQCGAARGGMDTI